MKTLGKVLLIFMILSSMFVVLPQSKVLAADNTEDVSAAIGGISATNPSKAATETLKTTIGKILGFLQVASGLVAVLMIAFNGFRYITSAPDIKSEIIKNVAPILAGLILVFGAVSFAKFIVSIAG